MTSGEPQQSLLVATQGPRATGSVEVEMKVCLLSQSFLPKVGGMEMVVHHLANALQDLGCQVTVIAGRCRGPGAFKGRYDLVRYGFLFRGAGKSGVDLLSGVFTLIRENNRRRFDVINCHGVADAGNRIVVAKRFVRAPLVMTPHGEDIQRVPEIGYGYRLKRRSDWMIRRNLEHADAVTAISDAIKNELDSVPDDKIFVIPNGIDTQRFVTQESTFLHERLLLDRRKRIVLSVGRNHIKKGYGYGIRAFQALTRSGSDADLVYVIVGRETEPLESLLHEPALQERVFLLPEMGPDDVLRCFQSAWCFFSPSIIEGLSLVSIEAMATGLPLVVTDVPGNADIVRDNQCGLIVQSKDPDSMADGLRKLSSNPALYDEFSKRALERAALYDWKHIAARYMEVYRTVMRASA